MRKVALPGIGTAAGFGGDAKDPETFFAFTSFNRPTTIYRYDVASGEASDWAAPKVRSIPTIIASSSASTRRRTARACRCSSSARRA